MQLPALPRRALLAGLAAGGLLIAGRLALPGMLRRPPGRPLPDELQDFVDALLTDLDREQIWDVHAHLIGLGRGTDCFISSDMSSHLHPIQRLQYEIYMASAGFGEDSVDRDYLAKVVALQQLTNPQGRVMLLAFDMVVREDGSEDAPASSMHTPNDYVLEAAATFPEVEAVASIHPYRADAVERLRAAHAAGARAIKWLPGAMHIDPASALCQPFYDALAELDLPLITHAGAEAAVASHAEDYGNPLRLRSALEQGVRVVVAHCASLGEARRDDGELVPAWQLFLEMMDAPEWEGRLFGDLSAITQINRCEEPLAAVLGRADLHHRLLNGSDFPLPAVDPLVSTRRLEQLGYLTERERLLCNGVFEHNPLLFDLVVKRCLRWQGQSLGAAAFETRGFFTRAS